MKLGQLHKLAQAISATGNNDIQAQIRNLGLDPNNLYQELEMTSAYVDTHRDSSFSNANIMLHSHTFYEIIYCCNTCNAEYLVGSERYSIRQGDIIFVPPGTSHRPLLPENLDKPYMRYVLWMSQEFMDQFALLFPYPIDRKQVNAGLLRTGETSSAPLGDLFKAGVIEAEKQADGWEAVVRGNTLVLLTMLKRATDNHKFLPPKAEQPQLLDKLTAYVEENYASKITLGEVAKQFYISESTISHLCKEKLGVSFYQYITQRRLIAAKSLIEQGVHLEDVALRSGFGDYSGFYRAFRQTYGITPRQYKNL
jgi:AraC-like DNA-binding protein